MYSDNQLGGLFIYAFHLLILFLPVKANELNEPYKLGSDVGFARYPDDLHLGDEGFSGCSVLGFGDFNSDKFTDLVLLHEDGRTLQVAIFDEKVKGFVLPPEYKHVSASEVVNVIPADWSYDGRLDLLVLTATGDDKVLDMEVVLGTQAGLSNTSIPVQQTSVIQPLVVDLNGDMKPDLLGYRYSQAGQGLELTAWINVAGDNWQLGEPLFKPQAVDATTLLPTGSASNTSGGMCQWKSPHSNAFIDLNGDCLPDIFVVCEGNQYQIWLNQPARDGDNTTFYLDQSGELPEGAGPVVFSDLHGEGALSMVFSTCDRSGCTIHTVENKQKPLCKPFSALAPGTCRPQEALCSADPDFHFGFADPVSHLEISLASDLTGADMPFLFRLASRTYSSLLPVRVGDYNLDGYPDLLITVSDSDTRPSKTAVLILESVPCTKDTCSAIQVASKKRTYRPLAQAIPLDQTARSYDGHFFDFEEDGTLDLLLTTQTGNGRRLVPIKNGLPNDAFFLKTLVSNGACPRSCAQGHPYGVNYVGATIKLTVVDPAGTTHSRQAAQLPQTAYFNFQPPYSHFGLGRTNNYLQQLSVGVSRNRQARHFKSWSGVIPNSQLVILPYQSLGSTDPTEWTRELFLNPGRAARWVLATLVGCMAGLASVVMVLAWLEKREDEKERRKAIHHINFDAL